MATTERPPDPGLGDESPPRARVFAFAALWLLLAMGAVVGAFAVAMDAGLAPLLRLLLVPLILAVALLTLMLASDSIEQGLPARLRTWDEGVYWLATSVAVLAVVILGGAAVTLLIPDRPGFWHIMLDFGADLVLGAFAGLLAVLVLTLAGTRFGAAISRVQRRLGSQRSADRWMRGSTGEQHPESTRRQLARGAVIGAAGLLLSAACTALVTTYTPNHSGAAEAPTRVFASPWLTILAPLLLWFLGTGVAWRLFSRTRVYDGKQDLIAAHHVRHATHGTAFAVVLLIVWGSFAATTLEHRAEGRLWSGKPHRVRAVRATAAQWTSRSPYLARQFEPRFWLTRDERWSPTSINWYLKNSDTTTTAAFCQRAGCYQLDIPKRFCDGADPPGECAPSGTAHPALYYRYCTGKRCDPEAPEAPGVSWKVIQYWIFYNYDSLQAGMVTQWHQADWEQMSVLLRRTGNGVVRPVEVAYSEHCYGARLPAERVSWDGTHPVSYVGQGSHANYPRPVSLPVRQLRCSLGLTPRYFGVAGLFFAPAFDGTSIELPLAYTIGLRDHAQRTRLVRPLPLLPLAATPVMHRFPGAWGRDNDITFVGHTILGLGPLPTGAGPPAPPAQAPWRQVFSAMLCSHRWLSTMPHDRTTTSWVCPPA